MTALFKGGHEVLFLGVETYSWSDAQFTSAAEFAKSHGFTGLALKVADGGDLWYGGYAGIAQKVALLEKVLPVLPYTYAYAAYVPAETAILAQLLKSYGGAIVDMEVEFNGQVAAAQTFEQAMRPVPGVLYCTTWADPVQQNWTSIINILAPCVNAWIPQEYDDFLEQSANTQYAKNLIVYPAIDLTQEDGPNDPVQIAKDAQSRGDAGLFVWEYQTAMQNTALINQIISAFGGEMKTYGPNSSDFNKYFKIDANGNWIRQGTNIIIQGSNKDFYSKLSIDGDTLPVIGLPEANEEYQKDADGYQWSFQPCERAVAIIYDPQHKKDSQPGGGASYLGKLSQFISLSPDKPAATTVVYQVPAAVQADIKQLESDFAKLVQDASA